MSEEAWNAFRAGRELDEELWEDLCTWADEGGDVEAVAPFVSPLLSDWDPWSRVIPDAWLDGEQHAGSKFGGTLWMGSDDELAAAASLDLKGVRVALLYVSEIDDAVVKALAELLRGLSLRELTLSTSVGGMQASADAISVLLDAIDASALRELTLNPATSTGWRGYPLRDEPLLDPRYRDKSWAERGLFEMLTSREDLAGLRTLHLPDRGYNSRSTESFTALLQSPAGQQLECLEPPSVEDVDGAIEAFTAWSGMRKLEQLNLRTWEVAENHVRTLLDASEPALQYLTLRSEQFGDDGAEMLAQHPAANTLKGVNVRRCGITDDGARALARLEQLDWIDVSENPMTTSGVEALTKTIDEVVHEGILVASAEATEALDAIEGPILDLGTLDLWSKPNVAALLDYPDLERFTTLIIEDCRVDEEDFGPIVARSDWRNITSLTLGEYVPWDGIFAALEGPLGQELLHLSITGAQPPEDEASVVTALVGWPRLAQLQTLQLLLVGELPGLVAQLVGREDLSVRTLGLRGMWLEDDNIQLLADAPWFAQLEHLDLRDNDMSTTGFHALLKAARKLQTLTVDGNEQLFDLPTRELLPEEIASQLGGLEVDLLD